jgi:hypothetical protein
MFKVNIQSLIRDISWGAELPTLQEAEAWLSQQIGRPNRLPQREKAVSECSQEELDSAISIENDIATLPAQFTSSIVDITAQKAQEAINAENKKFLADTDYKVLRHIRQKALNIQTTLTEQEYLALEQERHDAASAIVE